MRTEQRTVKIKGRVTSDAWGGRSDYGEDCKFIHDESEHETINITEVLNEFSGQNVTIKITQD